MEATNYIYGFEKKWEPKTSDFNAIVNKNYIVDTTIAPVTATLPDSPINGSSIKFAEGGNFSINNLLINRNGKTIENENNNLIIDIENYSFELVYYDDNWNIV